MAPKIKEIMDQGYRPHEHELAPAWLSVDESCRYLSVSPAWFYRDIMPKLDVRKLGKRTMVRRLSIDRFMDSLPAQPAKGLRRRDGLKLHGG